MLLHIIDIVFLLLAVVAAYYFWVRPVILNIKALQPVFKELDQVEAGWRAKLLVAFNGLKTLIFARLIWLPGAILALYDLVQQEAGQSGINLKDLIPDQYDQYIPLGLFAIGMIIEWLRRITTSPVAKPDQASS